MRHSFVALLCVVAVGLASSPGQARVTLKNWGDRLIIPGEKVRPLKIGETKASVLTQFGRPQSMLMQWARLGPFETWMDMQGFRAGTCSSNQRIFAFYARVPFLNLTLPEPLSPNHSGFTDFVRAYGTPDKVETGGLAPMHVFKNGFVAGIGEQGLRAAGVFNPHACETNEPIPSTYIRWLGYPTVTKIMLARTTDDTCNNLTEALPAEGESLPVFGKDELVCMVVDLTFPPTGILRTIPFVRRFTAKADGQARDVEIPRTIVPGQSSLTIKHWMGRYSGRLTGQWVAQTLVIDPSFGGERPIAAREFLVK